MNDDAAPHDASRTSRSGIVIVVVAVVIALLVLGRGYGSARTEVDGNTASPQATTTIVTTTTTLPGRPPAEVKVKSVNATTTAGLAGKVRDMLNAKGYTQVALGDATTKQVQSDVFYLPGYEGDAQAVAAALGITAANVRPMPDPPPVSPGDATVMVMAGSDLA